MSKIISLPIFAISRCTQQSRRLLKALHLSILRPPAAAAAYRDVFGHLFLLFEGNCRGDYDRSGLYHCLNPCALDRAFGILPPGRSNLGRSCYPYRGNLRPFHLGISI